MKIISGKYKGRVLTGFDIDGTRPTMDRVQESLFAMIQDYLDSSVVLDLFSGSGNLGIEAVSNGAKIAYLVDNNKKAKETINKNIKTINIKEVEVLNLDFKKALLYFKNNSIKFDIIFLDPPYKTNYIEQSIELINEYDLIKDNGIIICESSDLNRIIYPNNYKIKKDKKYGDKYIVIISKI